MGTRSATKIKLRNAQYKCDICGRKLMTAEALKSHQQCVHKVTNKPKTKVTQLKQAISKYKSQTPKIKNLKLVELAVSKSKSTPSKKVSSSKPAAKSTVINASEETLKPFPVDMANAEYECPKCMKIFPIYFSAHRHIQKSHCVNEAGEKVSPNSQHLIKPIVKQLCKVCNERISETEPHICGNIRLELDDAGISSLYVCSGCKQQFISLRLFDLHVAGLHCDGVESMFFPSIKEFQIWKDDMELQTKVRYATFGTYNSKQIYRCTFLPEGSNAYDETTSYFCPSTIAVQEFSKGIQVHFYKDHYSHCFEGYVLANKYKKYSLTTLLQNSDGYTQINELKEDETDLYLQFKKLMECIVLDAAKINIATLKILIGKALDMTSVLNNYEEDPDSDSLSTKRVIEDKITWVLGELGGGLGEKRKLALNMDKPETEPITKRFKTRIYQHNAYQEQTLNSSPLSMLQDSTIKIINSFSLAQPEISKAINELDSENEEVDPLLKLNEISPMDNQIEDTPVMLVDKGNNDQPKTDPLNLSDKIKDESPSSFNDSYKDFVVKNFNVTPIPSKSKPKNKSNISNQKSEPSKIDISSKPNVSKEPKITNNNTTSANGVKPYSPLLSKPKLTVTGVGRSRSETNMGKSKLLDTSIDKAKTESIPVKTRSSEASFKSKLSDTSQEKTKSESIPGKTRLSEASIGKTKTIDTSMGKRKTLESSSGNRKAPDITSSKRKSLESSVGSRKASDTTTSSKTKSLESSISSKKVLETSLGKMKTLNTSLSKTKAESSPNKRRNKSLDTGLNLPKNVDLKYEVKERENDCNILILKI
ncbi:unnamed protein product [Parnassius apollo]|uniref:(apollo) hypothetical protein n=1 Tax=Parnassius apollo TaxID=110799 RepID=A0A8S3X2R0_PARAO|nr:unnamed protein product [Parnassius apollo]